MTLRLLFSLLIALTSHGTLAADPEPLMAVRGKVLFADDFKGTALGPKWKGGKLGEWTVNNGVLACNAHSGDSHDPYLYLLAEFEFKDVVVEFGFKFEQSSEIDLCVRDTNSKEYAQGSHVLRSTVRPNLAQVVDLREGVMKWENYRIRKDPKAAPEQQKALAEKLRDRSGNFKAEFDKDAWHQVRVEIVGEEILMSVDGKPLAYLQSTGIGHPKKNQIGFSCGKSASFKPLTMWAVTANPAWVAKRDALVRSLSK